MRLLLDTHVLLWAMLGSPVLGKAASALLASKEHDIYFSAVNVLEIAIKAGLGRPDFTADAQAVATNAAAAGFLPLPVAVAHAANLRLLPALHKDPFDRLLLSQAQIEGMTLLSRDAAVLGYGALA
ncbi:MAG: type II toxin-antitoxin system VapC family toxin, partial [Burkholderiaceae bacterium]